jgi:hypothetical protein
MAITGALAVARQEGFSAVRANTERASGRLRAGMWPVVQTAVAATLAWSAAALVLGHERPFVAAIAAVISIGAVAGQTLKRAVEWIFGVAVGLTVADLIMLAIGTGPVQTGIMVGLAMTVALLIRGGIMFWTEAGVSALLVAGLDPSTHGVSPDRFLEALVGVCRVWLWGREARGSSIHRQRGRRRRVYEQAWQGSSFTISEPHLTRSYPFSDTLLV